MQYSVPMGAFQGPAQTFQQNLSSYASLEQLPGPGVPTALAQVPNSTVAAGREWGDYMIFLPSLTILQGTSNFLLLQGFEQDWHFHPMDMSWLQSQLGYPILSDRRSWLEQPAALSDGTSEQRLHPRCDQSHSACCIAAFALQTGYSSHRTRVQSGCHGF